MKAYIQNINKVNIKFLQYFLLISFTLFSLYFSISAYRFTQMNTDDLKAITKKVDAISFKKAVGKQGKPEVWLDLGLSDKYRVAYGNNEMLYAISQEIKKEDFVTIYVKKSQNAFVDFGNENDILQISKSGHVIYSLDVPQQNFHDYYLLSAIMTLLLPLVCIFYWIKSKSNMVQEALQASRMQSTLLGTELKAQ